MLLILLASLCCCATGSERYADKPFLLGPVAPSVDLRNMLRAHIVRRCCEQLDKMAATRRAAFESGQWQPWRDAIRKQVRADLGDLKYGPNGADLNIRVVSRYEQKGFSIENVLFESLPSWDVNASLYLPDPAAYPPPWPAVVVPVGHSGKQMSGYQLPAQAFARLGYAAVLFDPPGMAGEKQGGNDHFIDGVRCYLTGESSNRYFVIDALRCIDYLATRKDVDMSHGVGMTGVSGGGYTTMFATLLDERITASGPACCAVPNAFHPVLDVYAPCVETLAENRFKDGYDDIDILVAAAPTPVLLMAGAKDEVFKSEWSDQIAAETKQAFAKAGCADRFLYFSAPGGHDYTVAMAIEFVKWMDCWVRRAPGRTLPPLRQEDVSMVPAEWLKCAPRLDSNMFTQNRERAVYLSTHRSALPITETAAQLARVPRAVVPPKSRAGERSLVWVHWFEELMLQPEDGIELPATFLYPARENWRGAAILYFDDRGRWTDLRAQGMLATVARFADRDVSGPAVMTVDLCGWGDTKPADLPYEIAGWADRERWTAYVSAAMGDPVLAMRIRDGLATLAYLRTRKEIDPGKIVVGGHGMGGVVAMHVAAIYAAMDAHAPHLAGVFEIDAPATFESFAATQEYAWSPEDFFPSVLRYYDLPQLARSLKVPALIINPLGAAKEAIGQQTASELYNPGGGLEIRTGLDSAAIPAALGAFVSSIRDK